MYGNIYGTYREDYIICGYEGAYIHVEGRQGRHWTMDLS